MSSPRRQPFAAGMLPVSTVSDLVKWDGARIPKRCSRNRSLTPCGRRPHFAKGKPATYGFGWEIGKVNGHRRLSHGGGIRSPRNSHGSLTTSSQSSSWPTRINATQEHSARASRGESVQALTVKPPEPIADSDPKPPNNSGQCSLKDRKARSIRSSSPRLPKRRWLGQSKKLAKINSGLSATQNRFELVERQPMDKSTRLRYRAQNSRR